MEHEHYEKHVRTPKRLTVGFIDAVQSLIDAVINDTEVVYAECPLDEPVEPLTKLDQRAYGEVVIPTEVIDPNPSIDLGYN